MVLIGVSFILVLFLVFAVVFTNQTTPSGRSSSGGAKTSPAIATIGFHAPPSSTIATPYTVTGVNSVTATDITRNATIISLVNCLLVTDIVLGQEVQRAKVIRAGVYKITIDTTFSTSSSATVTMTVNYVLPSGSPVLESVPFASVACTSGSAQSLSVTDQLQLPGGTTVNIVMTTTSGTTDVTMTSWDVNLTEVKPINCGESSSA